METSCAPKCQCSLFTSAFISCSSFLWFGNLRRYLYVLWDLNPRRKNSRELCTKWIKKAPGKSALMLFTLWWHTKWCVVCIYSSIGLYRGVLIRASLCQNDHGGRSSGLEVAHGPLFRCPGLYDFKNTWTPPPSVMLWIPAGWSQSQKLKM